MLLTCCESRPCASGNSHVTTRAAGASEHGNTVGGGDRGWVGEKGWGQGMGLGVDGWVMRVREGVRVVWMCVKKETKQTYLNNAV